MLAKVVRADIFAFFSNLQGKQSISHHECNVSYRYFVDVLYEVEISLYYCFPESFYHERVLNFIKC